MVTQRVQLSNPAFDPATGVFIAQDHRPAALRNVDPRDLSPLLRALLVIDGTVTKLLEAYTLEPISITRLSQASAVINDEHRWLQAPPGIRIIDRQVMLTGSETGRLYAYAQSSIVPDRLSETMRLGLAAEPGGLGKILLDGRLEMRREGLWYGREQIADLPPPVAELYTGIFVTRTYRVIADGLPLMMITEHFPFSTGHVAAVG